MMHRTNCWRWWSCAAVALTLVVGCGERRPVTYPVEGVLRFEDGQPVTFGTVEFRSPRWQLSAHGKIDATGRFTLSTFVDGDGAVADEHQIVVTQHVIPQVWQSDAAQEHHGHARHLSGLVGRRYADYRTSGLTATVEPQSQNQIELRVVRQ